MCNDCSGTGYIERDACADGQCTDAIQVLDRCACNPEPDDFGYPGEIDYPEFDVPYVDFDPVRPRSW